MRSLGVLLFHLPWSCLKAMPNAKARVDLSLCCFNLKLFRRKWNAKRKQSPEVFFLIKIY